MRVVGHREEAQNQPSASCSWERRAAASGSASTTARRWVGECSWGRESRRWMLSRARSRRCVRNKRGWRERIKAPHVIGRRSSFWGEPPSSPSRRHLDAAAPIRLYDAPSCPDNTHVHSFAPSCKLASGSPRSHLLQPLAAPAPAFNLNP